jgi:hypothetical protein
LIIVVFLVRHRPAPAGYSPRAAKAAPERTSQKRKYQVLTPARGPRGKLRITRRLGPSHDAVLRPSPSSRFVPFLLCLMFKYVPNDPTRPQ